MSAVLVEERRRNRRRRINREGPVLAWLMVVRGLREEGEFFCLWRKEWGIWREGVLLREGNVGPLNRLW